MRPESTSAGGPAAGEAPAPWSADELAILRDGISVANLPTLLMLLVQMTGDLSYLDDPYRPKRARGMSDNDSGGLPEDVQETIREAAFDAIVAWRNGKPLALPEPSRELLLHMFSTCLVEKIPEDYTPLIEAQVHAAVSRPRPRHLAAPAGFRALVIGAGVSGLCAAIKLRAAGIDCTLIEKNTAVGGTWWENRYPGCGVDTPSHLYSFSFVPGDWERYFSSRDQLHQYLEEVADDFDVRQHIEFESEVVSAAYDAGTQCWEVEVCRADGAVRTESCNILISAVGALNRPKLPEIDGLDSFAGPHFHTATWPDGIDLTDARVGVIGNGASAMQVVPAIVDDVRELRIFQRSPQWVAPFEKHQLAVPAPLRFLLREVPLYWAWYRLRLGWTFGDKVHSTLQKDPSFEHPERAVNAVNDAQRVAFTQYMEEELRGRPDLLERSLPTYPPFGKRMLLDNGWFRSLRQDHVELVTEPISSIDGSAVVTSDGARRELDVLILATGFSAVRFLAPMDIRGRSGTPLRELWEDDDARAYLGTVVPDFPNFFILYGPNTQPGHGGSFMAVVEAQMEYVVSAIGEMLEQGGGAIECRQDVHQRYNERVDAAHDDMVWTHMGMETYYRNRKGRVVVNSPWRFVDYWRMTRAAKVEDFVVERRVSGDAG